MNMLDEANNKTCYSETYPVVPNLLDFVLAVESDNMNL